MADKFLLGFPVSEKTVDSVLYQNGNNVGIGTTLPDTKLTVLVGSTADYVLNANNRLKVKGDGTLWWGAAADYGKLTWDTGKAIVRGQSGKALSLGANNTQDTVYISTSQNVGIGTDSPEVSLDLGNNTDAIRVPNGPTADRPSGILPGMIRYNTTTNEFEGYSGTLNVSGSWGSLGGSGGSSGGTTNVVVDTFSGDNSNRTFDVSNTIADEDNVQIYIDGVYQSKSNYSTSGTTITFTTAPNTGTNNIEVTHFVSINGTPSIEVDTFNGNGTTGPFTLTTEPATKNNLQIYIDGVYQAKANYSVSGAALTFTTAPESGTNNIEVTHLKIA